MIETERKDMLERENQLVEYERAKERVSRGLGKKISAAQLVLFMRRFHPATAIVLTDDKIVEHAVGGGFAVEYEGSYVLLPFGLQDTSCYLVLGWSNGPSSHQGEMLVSHAVINDPWRKGSKRALCCQSIEIEESMIVNIQGDCPRCQEIISIEDEYLQLNEYNVSLA